MDSPPHLLELLLSPFPFLSPSAKGLRNIRLFDYWKSIKSDICYYGSVLWKLDSKFGMLEVKKLRAKLEEYQRNVFKKGYATHDLEQIRDKIGKRTRGLFLPVLNKAVGRLDGIFPTAVKGVIMGYLEYDGEEMLRSIEKTKPAATPDICYCIF